MRRPGSPPPPVEYFPPDATPIPYGADEDDLNDLGVIRTALFANFGNIKLAATALGVAPGQLSRVVEASVDLKTDRDAARRMIVDQAEAIVVEQLTDERNTDRRDEASKFVLTTLGKSLGWGSQATAPSGFSMSDGQRTLSIRWMGDAEP